MPPLPDVPSLHVGSPRDFSESMMQVSKLVKSFAPSHDLWPTMETVTLVSDLFAGRLPGYQTLQTPYHNSFHTLEVFVCAARLLDGLSQAGRPLPAAGVDAVLAGALLHDTGYVMTEAENGGSGAQYTMVHVERGVHFADAHCRYLAAETHAITCHAILATDHHRDPLRLEFVSEVDREASMTLATADIVAQMASREYLERLMFLHFEFREAGIGSFSDVHDLLEKTAVFYRATRQRLAGPLGGVVDLLALHFEHALGERRNYYMESIDRNIAYLEAVVAMDRPARMARLKRGGIVEQAMKQSVQ